MKKRTKIKLSLNSQTIRRLATPALKEVQGGWADDPDSAIGCFTYNCNGRGCG